jgi:hypothetical protein
MTKIELKLHLDMWRTAFMDFRKKDLADEVADQKAYEKICDLIDKNGKADLIRVVNHEHDLTGENK